MSHGSAMFRHIRALAPQKGWQVTDLDPYSDSLIRVTDQQGRSTLVGTGRHSAYPLNGGTAAGIAKDKAHTATLLREAGIKTPETTLIFLDQRWQALRPQGREMENAPEIAAKMGYPLIVKPNEGANGVHVFQVENAQDLSDTLSIIQPYADAAVLQRPISGREYRLFILDGVPIYAHQKQPARQKIEDALTFDAFVCAETKRRRAAGMPPIQDLERDIIQRQLAKAGCLTGEGIIKAGSLLLAGVASNLSQNGGLSDFQTVFDDKIHAFATRLQKVTKLRVMGVDLMGEGATLSDTLSDTHVLEVNANPGMKALSHFGREDLAQTLVEAIIDKSLKA